MASETEEFIREAQESGWHVTKTANQHLRCTHPMVEYAVFAPSTPSDHRSYRNARAKMRRALPKEPVKVERRKLASKPEKRKPATQPRQAAPALERKERPSKRPMEGAPGGYFSSLRHL